MLWHVLKSHFAKMPFQIKWFGCVYFATCQKIVACEFKWKLHLISEFSASFDCCVLLLHNAPNCFGNVVGLPENRQPNVQFRSYHLKIMHLLAIMMASESVDAKLFAQSVIWCKVKSLTSWMNLDGKVQENGCTEFSLCLGLFGAEFLQMPAVKFELNILYILGAMFYFFFW